MRCDRGFTLVELMVVVLIVGILVAVAIPMYNDAADSAKTKTCYANLRTFDGAVEQWRSSDRVNSPTTRWGVQTDAPLDGAGSLIADLSPFVKDCDKAAYCPKGGQYHVTVTADDWVEFVCHDHGDAYR
jgi:prepilin-type N-terminal cleavage/methylation domain-containing protein